MGSDNSYTMQKPDRAEKTQSACNREISKLHKADVTNIVIVKIAKKVKIIVLMSIKYSSHGKPRYQNPASFPFESILLS